MLARIMGLESEHSHYGLSGSGDVRTAINKILATLPKIFPRLLIKTKGSGGDDDQPIYWLPNGFKIYRDVGDHPEIATPRSQSARDIVIFDKVAERIIKKLVCLNSSKWPNLTILKNNVSYRSSSKVDGVIEKPVSWGSHENFLVLASRTLTEDHNLVPHLITRIIWSGSGHIEEQDNGDYSYVFSSRVKFINASTDPTGSFSTASRPFILVRREASYVGSRWGRHQVVCGESNMLELPTYLKFLTTHLVFRLTEEGWSLPNQVTFKDNVRTFQTLNSDIYLEKGLELMNGSFKTAIDIQKIYLEAAKSLNPLSDEEREGIGLWEWVLALLSQDLKKVDNLKKLRGVLDWVTKWFSIRKRMEERNFPIGHQRILGLNLLYHSLSDLPQRSLWNLLNLENAERPFIYKVVSKKEIKRAMFQLPGGCDRIRCEFINLVSDLKPNRFRVNEFNWSEARVSLDDFNQLTRIDFGHDNPFALSTESFERFKKLLLPKATIL